MPITRRDFLARLGKAIGVGAVATAAATLPTQEIREEPKERLAGDPDLEKVERYWYLKEFLGSAEAIRLPWAEENRLWAEYYALCDELGTLGGEPRVRVVEGETVIFFGRTPRRL